MARMTLADFDTLLVNRGFDGLQQNERYQLINFAYRKIAKKFAWKWEKQTVDLSLNPGSFSFALSGAAPDIPNFRTLRYLHVTTDNYRKRLTSMDGARFYGEWLTLDLTAAQFRGEPSHYFIDDNLLYVLPPPQATRNFRARILRRVTDLDNTVPGTSDTPITPSELDQAIVLASLVNTHNRVHEVQLAMQAQSELNEFFDMELSDEEWEDENTQDRVEPDNTWL